MGARVAQAHHSLVRHSSCKMASEVDQVRILAPQMDRRTVCGMLSSTKLMLPRLIAGIPQSLIATTLVAPWSPLAAAIRMW